MRARCHYHGDPAHSRYASKGIKVCKRWDKFENFLEDMGPRPKGKTLDRINPNKGYSKANCRWATPKQQSANRTTVIKYKGKTIREWADKLGIPFGTLKSRYYRTGTVHLRKK